MSTVSSLVEEDGLKRPKPKGAVLFTGPDGRSDYRVKVEETFYIGHGYTSPEASSNTNYICRPAPNVPHPVPKSARVGEIGWGIPGNSDHSLLKTGNQIMLKEFRQATEDRYTHRYQTPYYPDTASSSSRQCPVMYKDGSSPATATIQTASIVDEQQKHSTNNRLYTERKNTVDDAEGTSSSLDQSLNII